MTTKPYYALIQAACISLFFTLSMGTASAQEPKESGAVQPPSKDAGLASQQISGETVTPAAGGPPSAATKPEEPLPSAPAAATAGPAAEQQTEYIVKKGDTLWDIANAHFKDPFLWPFLWKANPSITNPDLIYPGNKLAIPSLAPVERAMQAPAEKEQLVEKQAPAAEEAPVTREGIAAATVTRPKPAVPGEEGAPAGGEKLILPEEEAQPVTDKYSFLSAGFVNDEESVGTIVSSAQPEKTILGYDDVVYIRFNSNDAVNVGDKFLIYAPLQKVKHPKTHEPWGRLTRGLGIVQITAKDPAADVVTGRITLSFDSVEPGSLLTPYQEPVLVYQSAEKKAKDISGYILEVTDRRTINGQMDVVYLDKGRVDGVDPGDTFVVYADPEKRGYPREMIGEVQVFLVKERSSTAVVRLSRDALRRGQAVDFKR